VWDFPGGHVEKGEHPLDALGREILEEIGVAVQLKALTQTPDLRVHERDLDLSLWAVRAWEGEPVNCAPNEHDQVQWFDIKHAVTMTLAFPAYRPWLSSDQRALGREEGSRERQSQQRQNGWPAGSRYTRNWSPSASPGCTACFTAPSDSTSGSTASGSSTVTSR
jgi:8-oxo-dGTP diphosphatase